MNKIILILSLVLIPTIASAQVGKRQKVWPLTSGISAGVLTSDQTFYIDDQSLKMDYRMHGSRYVLLVIDFTHSNNGVLGLTCTGGATRATATATITTATETTGTFTLNSSGVWNTASLSADFKYSIFFRVGPWPVVKCVLNHGGTPDGSDLVTITGWVVDDG